jgi:sulfate adenylyltransferase large subunit
MTTATPTNTLLRVSTAGSVDDGKSTLLGRLLYEAQALFDDQLAAIEKQKRQDGELDLSLVTDGLKSEREQGITIDVAYKYFASGQRKYILADSPGHVQYTRNMVTAAALADVLLILVDARNGILEQTRRHAFLGHLLGVRHVVLAINKCDLVDYDQARIQAIEQEFRNLSWNHEHDSLQVIPVSALKGDNVSFQSQRTPWYDGPPLIDYLDGLPTPKATAAPPYLPVQLVTRDDNGQRFALGTLQQGRLQPGAEVAIFPSRQQSRIRTLYAAGEPVDEAESGQAIALAIDDEIDLERGSLLYDPSDHWEESKQLAAELVWFDDQPFEPETRYVLRMGVQTSRAFVETIDYQFDLVSLEKTPASTLTANAIARVQLHLAKPVYLRNFQQDRYAGSFILIDPQTNRTVAAGLVDHFQPTEPQRKSGGRLHFVDQLPEDDLDQSIVLPESFFAANAPGVRRQLVETLHELGWNIYIENGTHSEPLKQSWAKRGWGTHDQGSGI